MRHLNRIKKLNRTSSHRKAMFSNMLASFINHERIKTTSAKAKELRRVSEKMITRAKENTLHNKRVVMRRIKDRDAVAKLFNEIAPRYREVNGGYTRVLKLKTRQGDGAEISLIEFLPAEHFQAQKKK